MHLGLKHLAVFALALACLLTSHRARAGSLIAQMTDQENEISEDEGESEDAAVEEASQAAEEEAAPDAKAEAASVPVEEEENNAFSEEFAEGDGEAVSYLKPYRQRRNSWGSLIAIGYSGYSPEDYDPSFVLDQFTSYYGNAETPLVEFTVSPKKNFSFMSFGLDIGVGYYVNRAPDTSELSLIPVRLGLNLSLDTFFDEPYVVPYGTIGLYTMLYREAFASQAVSGNTAMGLYYSAGLRFQLDWVDSDGDYSSYDENGMENTFLFVEARSFLLPNNSEPDLGSPGDEPIGIGGGFAVEF
jgi:hypothetical protein